MKTREVISTLSELMNAHELEGGVDVFGGTDPRVHVFVFGHDPVEAAKWIRMLDTITSQSTDRRNAGRGNDVYVRVRGKRDGLIFSIDWNTYVETSRDDRPEWYRGKDFLAKVAFVKADHSRHLTDEELTKFLDWAEKEPISA